MTAGPETALGRVINEIEETLIALFLGLMTLITFANVVARYIFNSNILWALEATVFLFAWLVLLGTSYLVKTGGHLGVDVLVRALAPGPRKAVTIAAVGCCIVFAALLMIGSWQYWLPFAGERAWYEVNDITMPDWLRFIEPILNEGEPYEKLPRFIPYFALPFGMTLLTYRFLELAWSILQGEDILLIASHEAEDLVEEAARKNEEER